MRAATFLPGRDRPFIIGVAGGSGSGKSTLVRALVEALGEERVTVIEQDHYYRDRSDLSADERRAINAVPCDRVEGQHL